MSHFRIRAELGNSISSLLKRRPILLALARFLMTMIMSLRRTETLMWIHHSREATLASLTCHVCVTTAILSIGDARYIVGLRSRIYVRHLAYTRHEFFRHSSPLYSRRRCFVFFFRFSFFYSLHSERGYSCLEDTPKRGFCCRDENSVCRIIMWLEWNQPNRWFNYRHVCFAHSMTRALDAVENL